MALIDNLVQALQVLPGVGPKSAQRMALTLLQRNRSGGTALGNVLLQAMAGCYTHLTLPTTPYV